MTKRYLKRIYRIFVFTCAILIEQNLFLMRLYDLYAVEEIKLIQVKLKPFISC